MTTQRTPTPIVGSQMREHARRGARSLSGGLVAVLAGMGAMVVVFAFIVLDYTFNQEAHRLIKIAAGIAGGLFIALQPFLGLHLLPIAAPFLTWLPQLPIPGINTLNGLLLSVFGVWALGRTLAREPIGRRAALATPMVLMLAIMLLGWARGAAIPTGYMYDAGRNGLVLFRTATTFAPYLIALLMVRGARDRATLLGAVVLGLVLESVTTIWFGEWMKDRAMGSMSQPNVLGAFLVISTVIVSAVMMGQKQWFLRVLLAGAVTLGAYATLLTISRGAMIALSVGFLYVAVRSSRVVTLLLLAGMLTSPLWAPENVKTRVMGTSRQVEESDDTELEGSAQARLDTWNATVQIATDHFFDGVGFGALGYVLRDTGTKMGLEHTKDSTHNTFLRVLGELGILGLSIYLFLLWKCWSLAHTGIRMARSRFDRQLAVGMAGATLSIVANCWFGDRFFEFDIMCTFWLVAALVNDAVLRASEAPA